jgi:hypothetical protein
MTATARHGKRASKPDQSPVIASAAWQSPAPSLRAQRDNPPPRHCERSVTIPTPSLRAQRDNPYPVIASAAWQSPPPSLRAQRGNPPPRHCERSVAIHVSVRQLSWIASFLAMTATIRHCERSEAVHGLPRVSHCKPTCGRGSRNDSLTHTRQSIHSLSQLNISAVRLSAGREET